MQNLGDVTIWTIGENNGDFDIEDPSFLDTPDVRTTDRKKRKVKYIDRLIKSVARMARIDVKRQSPEYVICEERKSRSSSDSRKRRRRRTTASPIRVMSVPSTCSDDSDVSLPTSESDIDELLHGSYLQESRAITTFPDFGSYSHRPRVLGRRDQNQYKNFRCPSSSKLASSSNLKQVSKSMAEIINDLESERPRRTRDLRSYEAPNLYRHKRRECNYRMMSESSGSDSSSLSCTYEDPVCSSSESIEEHIYESINSDDIYSEVLPVKPPTLPVRPIPGSTPAKVYQKSQGRTPSRSRKSSSTLPFAVFPELDEECLTSDSTLDLSRMRVPESYHDFTVDDVLASIQRIEQSDLTMIDNEDGEEEIPWDSFHHQKRCLETFC